MKANQVISGTALNMFAPRVRHLRGPRHSGRQQVQFTNTFRITSVPILGKIPFIGPLLFQNAYITTYIGIAIFVLSTIVLYKTRFGCACAPAASIPRRPMRRASTSTICSMRAS